MPARLELGLGRFHALVRLGRGLLFALNDDAIGRRPALRRQVDIDAPQRRAGQGLAHHAFAQQRVELGPIRVGQRDGRTGLRQHLMGQIGDGKTGNEGQE
jgi:hypothetical protein